MKESSATLVAVFLLSGTTAIAGFCSRCELTCTAAAGTILKGAGGDYYPVNRFDHEIVASNPHNDCVRGWIWEQCNTTGTAKCYDYYQKTWSYSLGAYVLTSVLHTKTTTKC